MPEKKLLRSLDTGWQKITTDRREYRCVQDALEFKNSCNFHTLTGSWHTLCCMLTFTTSRLRSNLILPPTVGSVTSSQMHFGYQKRFTIFNCSSTHKYKIVMVTHLFCYSRTTTGVRIERQLLSY